VAGPRYALICFDTHVETSGLTVPVRLISQPHRSRSTGRPASLFRFAQLSRLPVRFTQLPRLAIRFVRLPGLPSATRRPPVPDTRCKFRFPGLCIAPGKPPDSLRAHHKALAAHVKDGILTLYDAPFQETCTRSSADNTSLDYNSDSHKRTSLRGPDGGTLVGEGEDSSIAWGLLSVTVSSERDERASGTGTGDRFAIKLKKAMLRRWDAAPRA